MKKENNNIKKDLQDKKKEIELSKSIFAEFQVEFKLNRKQEKDF